MSAKVRVMGGQATPPIRVELQAATPFAAATGTISNHNQSTSSLCFESARITSISSTISCGIGMPFHFDTGDRVIKTAWLQQRLAVKLTQRGDKA